MNNESEPTKPHPEVNLSDPQVLPPTNAQVKQLFDQLGSVFDEPLSKKNNPPPSQEEELGHPGDFENDEVQKKFPGLQGLSVVELDDSHTRTLDCHLTSGQVGTMYSFRYYYQKWPYRS